MRLPNLRLPAARLFLPPAARRRELEELFARTAAAFGCPVPPPAGARDGLPPGGVRPLHARAGRGGAGARRRRRPGSLAASTAGCTAPRAGWAARYRLRLGVRSLPEALAAARLIYRGLGIDFRGAADGEVVVRRCAFAAVYTPRVCALVSALDRGLLAGLTGGGEPALHAAHHGRGRLLPRPAGGGTR